MSDLLSRIMYDVERIESLYGIESQEITVFMTYGTIVKIALENIGFVPALDEITCCGYKTRIMNGKGIEWDIGVSHGFSFDFGKEGRKL